MLSILILVWNFFQCNAVYSRPVVLIEVVNYVAEMRRQSRVLLPPSQRVLREPMDGAATEVLPELAVVDAMLGIIPQVGVANLPELQVDRGEPPVPQQIGAKREERVVLVLVAVIGEQVKLHCVPALVRPILERLEDVVQLRAEAVASLLVGPLDSVEVSIFASGEVFEYPRYQL